MGLVSVRLGVFPDSSFHQELGQPVLRCRWGRGRLWLSLRGTFLPGTVAARPRGSPLSSPSLLEVAADTSSFPNSGGPSQFSSACPPSTGDSWETAGWLGEVGYEAHRQVRTLFAAVSGPASARGRAVAARTGAEPRGALALRSRGSKLAATGPGLQAPSALIAARARDFPGAGKSLEFSPNPCLVTFRTLQQCR